MAARPILLLALALTLPLAACGSAAFEDNSDKVRIEHRIPSK